MTDITNDSSELFEHYRFVADKGQHLLRIDKFLVNKIENASRNKIQGAAEAGNIIVNGQPVKSNYKIKPGDTVSVVMAYPPHDFELIPQEIPLNIVFEDDHVIVLNKQAGLVVHPGFGNFDGTLVNGLAWHLKDLPLFSSGDVRPGLVHRLDKDTSGIMVIAKTEHAMNRLAKQFFDRTTERTYIALAWGDMKNDEGTITGNIGRSLKNRKKQTVFPEGDHGKTAVTHYKVIERLGYVNLISCKLETGRTHQIRAHLESIKHPLFNDAVYGGDKILRGTRFTKYKQFVQNCFSVLQRHALHAKSLAFEHPHTKEYLKFDSQLPDDMAGVIEKWRKYTANRI
jgi:23S rRNA pseudouridine1911/1915/1917 synthase